MKKGGPRGPPFTVLQVARADYLIGSSSISWRTKRTGGAP